MDTTLLSQLNQLAPLVTLDRTSDNACAYRSLRASANLANISTDAHCALPPGYRLIRVDDPRSQNEDVFEIALLNDVEGSVVYHTKVSVSVVAGMNGRRAARSLVWRSPNAQHAAVMREVAWAVFFNYILERFDTRLPISLGNGTGMQFWQRQASEAVARGLHVYYLFPSGDRASISTQTALNDLVDRLWSETYEQDDHSMLISRIAHSPSGDRESISTQTALNDLVDRLWSESACRASRAS